MNAKFQQLLQSGLQHHQAGRFEQAEQMYRQVLGEEPQNAVAMHYLGLLAHQAGQNETARDLIARSLTIERKNPGFYSNYSAVCRALGKTDDAIDAARQAVRLRSDYADGHNNLSLALMDAGKFDEAISAAKESIRLKPLNPNAHNSLGTALTGKADFKQAIDVFEHVTKMWPQFTPGFLNLGRAMQKLDQFEDSIPPLKTVLEREPENRDAHFALAAAYAETGKADDAITHAQKAVALRPNDVEAINMLGVALGMNKQRDEALVQFQRALELDPNCADALNNLGADAERQNKLPEAIEFWQRALAINPKLFRARANMANAMAKQGRFDQAITECKQIIALRPDFAQAYSNLGVAILKSNRQPDEALPVLRRAIELQPKSHEAYLTLGAVHERMGHQNDALTSYQKAQSLKGDLPDVYNHLASFFSKAVEYDLSEANSRKALELDPKNITAITNIANIMLDRQGLPQALEYYRKALELDALDIVATHNLLLAANYSDALTPAELAAEHFKVGERYDKLALDAPPHTNSRDLNRKLRIGYISPDFRMHVVSYFFAPIMANHDHDKFEIYLYGNVERPDTITDLLRSQADAWRDTWGTPDADVAKLIRDDKIDILVELAGHTQYTRVLVCGHKPAPVQVAAIGYPNTTGLKSIDYYLTDAFADPPGQSEQLFSETLWRLPETFWVYRPPAECPEVSPLPVEAVGHITFGSVNNFSKLNPTVLRTWARLLREVPKSTLLIQAKSLADRVTLNFVKQLFEEEGVPAERLLLRGWANMADYLKLFATIDILLDPFPYAGGTTTCHACWMGAPVVTLAGKSHLSRMGVSTMMNLGLPELIAETVDDYVRIARELAGDSPDQRARLATLRSELRERMRRSPLCDEARYVRNLEAAYREMFGKWASQK